MLVAIEADSFGWHIVLFTLYKNVIELIIVYVRICKNVLFKDGVCNFAC